MAAPSYSDVIDLINQFIITNGNNEITAAVLNPVLEFMTDFANNNMGDLSLLTTDLTDDLVSAINSLKQNFDDLSNNGVQLYTGVPDPNVTPPPTYNYADFYMQIDSIDSSPIVLWQWNGFIWVDASEEPATESDNVQNNSSVPGASVTDALNNLLINSGLQDGLEFIANGADNFINIGVTTKPTGAFLDSVLLRKGDWSFSGTTVTFTFTPVLNAIIQFT